MTTKRSFARPALVLAAVLAVAGCGGQPFPTTEAHPSSTVPTAAPATAQTPKARLLAAMQRTTAERTARVGMHMSFDIGDDESATIDASGVIDLTNKKLDLTGKTHSDNDEGDDETFGMRIVDGVAYTDENGRWTSMPFDGKTAPTTAPDPSSYVTYLQGIADDVRVDGHEPLRGVDTTRYMATVELDRALIRTAKTPTQRSLVQSSLSLFGDLKMPITAWVDAAGRLRKLNLTMNLTGRAAKNFGLDEGVNAKIEVTVEFYDFGVPVVVVAPAGAISAKVAVEDRTAQSDLRNALTAEKTLFTDNETYSADPATMKQIEPSLSWGVKLKVAVADAGGEPGQVICMSERSASGAEFAIADVAYGPRVGTYYAKSECPGSLSDATVAGFAASW